MATTYRLRRAPTAPVAPPMLDTSQQAVVAHEGGPLLVLAGPGTGKTTTMVEAIVDVVERRGVNPERVLALTFSRKAAEQLRDRVTARLQRTLASSLAATFHSFAYSLVRRQGLDPATGMRAGGLSAPLRLLSAPEQDVVLQELLTPSPEAVPWPDSLAAALRSRGFAREVQALLDRARENGLSGPELTRLGEDHGRPEWAAAGRFLEDYLTNLDSQSAVDYADLVVRAVRIAQRPEVRAELRRRYEWVFVDEYQDTDPSQVALLQALAGDGRNLVVVGDPDQSIYGFRGADVRGILDFPAQFPTARGERAPVLALQTTRRFGPALLAAAGRIATSIPVSGSVPSQAFDEFRRPLPVEGPFGAGELGVVHFDSARAETEHIADRLRRAHLEDGIGWSDMAVLVRSGRTTIPTLRRSLTAAGVPVEVASDDTPLVREPAVLPLLDGLRAALNLDNTDVADPDYLDADAAAALLMSPLGGLDAAELRSVARELRQRERTAAAPEDRAPATSGELVRRAVLSSALVSGIPGRGAAKLAKLARLLREVQVGLAHGDTAEEALWALWSGTSWPERLRSVATSGGSGALLAHRDLDAVCALFEEAAHAEEEREHTGVASFLAMLSAQQIPADTLADRGVRGEAVRLLTAHRSKGLEWRFVVVAHVQEEVWPDLRRRSSLLHADELPAPTSPIDGPVPPLTTRALLAEERRLFYVACTRARQRLLVTAVASPDEDGEQPSRFLTELVDSPSAVQGRPARPLSIPGLVADLRRTAADPACSPELQRAAARRLAVLATATAADGPVARQAHPDTWWGVRPRSRSDQPLRDPEIPPRISASALESLLACPARWFLQREAGGQDAATSAQGFGKIVHAVADRVAKGEVADLDGLMRVVDQVWGQLVFRTPWSGSRERVEVEKALERFLTWHSRPGARTVIGTEEELHAEVTVAGQTIRLYGFADRLELDEDGRVVVVDLKTGKNPPTQEQVDSHAQLGLYQHAVAHGAADHLGPGTPLEPGGAELVHLRHDVRGSVKIQLQDRQEPDADGLTLIEHQLEEVVQRIRDEEFPAMAGPHCDQCDFVAICPIKGAGTVLS